ncbi:MAG: restriction endonuclease [Desulfurivibrionaceae bacterium]|nr:restriction endonuclease [Pseudomonadota bacterium]MCG2824316.1 restriction endonuclease [Desulfobulbaceae bacterium]MDP2002444.1 restriction endonuclease [Desulfurivibrionaceae bacterium]PKN23214.1 MAG: restriction endonuclease [Deltaproteobacteria bacterium HGW-Deltaproteobacteria-3]MBU4408270.1 restriction endonuclease [Pseudomonadota bacterium]
MADTRFANYINPVIEATNALGGSARPQEVYKHIAGTLNLPDQVLNEEKKSGGSKFENQVAWARFYLAKAGIIDSSRHGVWSLTDKGRKITKLNDKEIQELIREVQAQSLPTLRPTQPSPTVIVRKRTTEPGEEQAEEPPPPEELNYRGQLLDIIMALPPDGFERLCQRLLRESGFQEVTVTGRSGDGGIDGIGILQINPFVSFKALFQSKRYSGSVSSPQVRDFRGAMMGRADKGIIITIGTFTADAKREAVRDGVPPIELVDGEMLLNMFEQLELGLKSRITYDIDPVFFSDFK